MQSFCWSDWYRPPQSGDGLDTAQRMLVANIMASVAQGQSDLISQRNKEIAARMQKLNRPCNGQKRLGFKLVEMGNHRQWVPDWEERAVMAEIVHLYDEEGRSFEVISDSVEQLVCECDGREFKTRPFFKRSWSPSKCAPIRGSSGVDRDAGLAPRIRVV